MIKKLLNTQTKSISFASLILACSYFFSALLGLFRDRLLAGRFGAGNESDVYYTAFTIPDFIALILIFGAISAAIIPIFTFYINKSKEEAWHYISALLNVFLSFLIIVCLIFIVFAPFFVSLIAPGFSESKREMTVMLMRIMFLSPILLGISNIISGILQVFHRFLVTALAPLMYNLGIIIGIVFLTPKFGLVGLAWGVVLGGTLHLLIQIPVFLYSGFKYTPFKPGQKKLDLWHPGVVKTLKLMAPRSLGLGAIQFNTIITTAIASTLAVGSISIFNWANNLGSILVNALSVSLSTAIFPKMSLAYSRQDKKDFEHKFSSAVRQILFLIIPISLLLFLLRAQIIRVAYGGGKFDWLDTRLTAACLGIFSLGLFAQGLVFILSKTFYAAHNTKIPAWISFVAVAFNISASLFLVHLLNASDAFYYFMQNILKLQGIQNISIVGLALAYSLTVILQASLLLYFLYKKYKTFRVSEMLPSVYRILLSSVVMIVFVVLVRRALVEYHFVQLQTFWGVFSQLAISGIVGISFYILTAYSLKSPELRTIKESFFQGRMFNRPNKP